MGLAAEREPMPRHRPLSEDENRIIKENLKIEELRDFLLTKAVSPDTLSEQKKILDWEEIKKATPERLRELQLLMKGVAPDKILPFPDQGKK